MNKWLLARFFATIICMTAQGAAEETSKEATKTQIVPRKKVYYYDGLTKKDAAKLKTLPDELKNIVGDYVNIHSEQLLAEELLFLVSEYCCFERFHSKSTYKNKLREKISNLLEKNVNPKTKFWLNYDSEKPQSILELAVEGARSNHSQTLETKFIPESNELVRLLMNPKKPKLLEEIIKEGKKRQETKANEYLNKYSIRSRFNYKPLQEMWNWKLTPQNNE